jgi:hypothetical protein
MRTVAATHTALAANSMLSDSFRASPPDLPELQRVLRIADHSDNPIIAPESASNGMA